MEFKTKHIGHTGHFASSIIEVTVSIDGAEITEEVTNLYSKIEPDFITALRELADELEEQNNKIAEGE